MKISIFGLGNVGSGLYNMLSNKKKIITFTKRNRFNCKVKKTFFNYKKLFINKTLFIELIGNINCVIEIVLNSIKLKNNYITANKELVSKYFFFLNYLFKLSNLKTFFEASVGGTIPIINLFNNYYFNNKILYLISIINGTTNFILSNLKKINFKKLIKLSIKKGFAEYKYSNDLLGIDSIFKNTILYSFLFKKFSCYLIFFLESIFGSNNFLKKNFYIKKHISIIILINNYSIFIISIFLTKNFFFYKIKNSLNLFILNCYDSKKHILIAPGAGSKETASAVKSNIFFSYNKKYFINFNCINNIKKVNKNYLCFNFFIYLDLNYNNFYILKILKIKIIKIFKKKTFLIKTKKCFLKKILFFLYYIKSRNFYIIKYI